MCSTDMLTIDNTRREPCPLEQKEDLSFFRNSGWVVVSRDSREVVHFRLIEWLFLECSGWISTQNSGDSWNNALHQSSEVYFNHWWSIWSTWIWLLTWRWNPAVRTKRLWNLIKIQRVTTVLFMALQTSPKFVRVVSWKRNKKEPLSGKTLPRVTSTTPPFQHCCKFNNFTWYAFPESYIRQFSHFSTVPNMWKGMWLRTNDTHFHLGDVFKS